MNNKAPLSYSLFTSQRNSLSSSTTSLSSFLNINRHNSSLHHHNNYFQFFSIVRLRLALYFICLMAITTSLYCLLSFKVDSLKSSAFNSIHPVLLTSTSQILDELISKTNRYYLEYFHYKSVSKNSISTLKINSFELSKLIYIIDNVTKSNREEQQFDLYPFNHHSHSFKNNKYLQERDNVEYIEFEDNFDEDTNSVEYHLQQLGFDLQHIIYLYALSHPNNIRSKNESFKSMTTLSNKAHYHQRFNVQLQINASSLLPNEFLNSIILMTAVSSNQFHLALGLIKSFKEFCLWSFDHSSNSDFVPKFVLIIYDLGLYPEQLNEVELLCNQTSTKITYRNKLCEIRKFQFNIYPSHISDLRIAAYRSIIIQEILRDVKLTLNYNKQKEKSMKNSTDFQINQEPLTLFWLDVQYRFINKKYHYLKELIHETLHQSGIMSWPIGQPTSALTHPRMFEYFNTSMENFYFHRMIRPGHLLISINEQTWEPFQWSIMLPWVRCALTSNCIAPLGSQWRSTCRLDKKPHYRYSGCHHYDMSALNVILGIAFNYSSFAYSARLSSRFFLPINKQSQQLLTTSQSHYQLMDNTDDNLFEYQFEDESKIPSRFDSVFTDDDLPANDDLQEKFSDNFLYSSLNSLPSSNRRQQTSSSFPLS